MAIDQISIGKFSIMTRLSAKALRLYDKKKILVPEEKDTLTGYRYYAIRQIEIGIRIKLLVNMGFSLAEITEILEALSVDKNNRIHILISKRLSETQLEIQRLKEIENVLINHQTTMDLLKMKISKPTTKEVPAFRVLSKTAIGPYGETIGTLIQEIMGEIYSRDNKRNMVNIAGPIMYICLDQEYKETDAHIEVAIPITGKVTLSNNGINLKNLPTCEMATILYTGKYDNVGKGYEAIFQYIETQGYQAIGPSRELYLNSPGQVSDEDLLTEIQVPISKQ